MRSELLQCLKEDRGFRRGSDASPPKDAQEPHATDRWKWGTLAAGAVLTAVVLRTPFTPATPLASPTPVVVNLPPATASSVAPVDNTATFAMATELKSVAAALKDDQNALAAQLADEAARAGTVKGSDAKTADLEARLANLIAQVNDLSGVVQRGSDYANTVNKALGDIDLKSNNAQLMQERFDGANGSPAKEVRPMLK